MLGQGWVDQTRRYLMGGLGEQRNTLSVAYTAGSGSLTFTYPLGAIQVGARLSIGLNTFYVWATSGSIATVTGGEDGSTDVNAANGAMVRVNPRFTDYDIWAALADDLNDLSSPTAGLFGINSTDLTYNPARTGYDMGATAATNLIDIYEVKYLTPGPEKDNPHLPSYGYRLNRQSSLTDAASGLELQILRPGAELISGYNVRVVWKSILVIPATTATDVSTVGLQTSAYDLPPMGAAIDLMAGREIKRNFTETQGDTRRATEVPPGAILQSSRGLQQRRQVRIAAEAARLDQMYPLVKD
jgi:hypothetical protein